MIDLPEANGRGQEERKAGDDGEARREFNACSPRRGRRGDEDGDVKGLLGALVLVGRARPGSTSPDGDEVSGDRLREGSVHALVDVVP